MRVVSQDRNLNMPYEMITLRVFREDIYANGIQLDNFRIAIYSNRRRADAAMLQCLKCGNMNADYFIFPPDSEELENYEPS